MATFGFIGPTYSLQSLAADCERCVNLYPESIESPTGKTKSPLILIGTPGLQLFTAIGSLPVQAEYTTPDGRGFAVSDNSLYEVFANGTNTLRGALTAGTRFCFATNPTQLLITNGPDGFILDLATSVLTRITAAGWRGGSSCAYIDGYFICLDPDSQIFTISSLNDGLAWDSLDFGRAEGAAGNFRAIIADHLDLWLMASDHSEAYYNDGNSDFPFTRRSGSFMQQGIAAAGTLCRLDNSTFWLGQDERGQGIVWRANGYTPLRISTHAIENAIAGYSTIDDATAYAYQWRGHSFYRIDFPTGNATWVYDCATGLWHEWLSFIGSTQQAQLGRTHTFAFGRHLLGDYLTGNIYELRADVYTDNGAPIVRMRTAPHISDEGNWVFYKKFTLDCQTGVGLAGGVIPGTDPQVSLECSDDGGFTWSDPDSISLGGLGDYRVTVEWRRLGRSRDRVFRVTTSDPVFICFVNAYLQLG